MHTPTEQEIAEKKKQELSERVFSVIDTTKNPEHQDFLHDKAEKITSENMETVERIFKSTESFYEASKMYEAHNKELMEKNNITESSFQGNPTKENKKQFLTSLECQQNTIKSNVLKLEAGSREFAMLLPLDGLAFLKSVGINDREDQEEAANSIDNEIFKAKFFGFLAKFETKMHILKKNFSGEIGKILSTITSEM
ncbi:MAG: hypothetical protein RL641_912 [Candidatus Parcubacteria bacterium]